MFLEAPKKCIWAQKCAVEKLNVGSSDVKGDVSGDGDCGGGVQQVSAKCWCQV